MSKLKVVIYSDNILDINYRQYPLISSYVINYPARHSDSPKRATSFSKSYIPICGQICNEYKGSRHSINNKRSELDGQASCCSCEQNNGRERYRSETRDHEIRTVRNQDKTRNISTKNDSRARKTVRSEFDVTNSTDEQINQTSNNVIRSNSVENKAAILILRLSYHDSNLVLPNLTDVSVLPPSNQPYKKNNKKVKSQQHKQKNANNNVNEPTLSKHPNMQILCNCDFKKPNHNQKNNRNLHQSALNEINNTSLGMSNIRNTNKLLTIRENSHESLKHINRELRKESTKDNIKCSKSSLN